MSSAQNSCQTSTAQDFLTAQHSTAQHSTAQHSTAQHSTAQHSTAQHSTAWVRPGQASTIRHGHGTARHSTALQLIAQHTKPYLDCTEVLQKVGQAVAWVLKHSGGLASVKHVGHVDAKVSLQPLNVLVGTMQYLHNLHTARHADV